MRYDKLMRVQQTISHEINRAWVGKTLPVLVDDVQDGWLVGRSHRDAPEIDGLVFVSGEGAPGDIVQARVIQAEPYDLYAEAVGSVGQERRELVPLRQAAPRAPQ